MEEIRIQGAHIHNLKNISLRIPKHKLIVVTGVSGSGKSSLAFDILFEEGKNQYLRSIGILAGLDNEDRFDSLEGIGPTVSVKQNTVRQSNPRSTVGSKTGILNQLALLFTSDGRTAGEQLDLGARPEFYSESGSGKNKRPGDFLYTTADGMCITCQGKGYCYEVDLEHLVPDRKMTLQQVFVKMHVTAGFMRLLDKRLGAYFQMPFWELPEEIQEEAVYGTFENGKQSYCIERILKNAYEKGEDVEEFYGRTVCPDCQGERVGEDARMVTLHGKRIGQLGQLTLSELDTWLREIPREELTQFGRNVVLNISHKLHSMIQFRLGHLTLYREMSTLSGGEIQRVFLHLHLESRLDSLIYIFDEPMAGLHPSEKQGMIKAVQALRDMGNTVIVVEHDEEMICHADQVIEIGPKAGVDGGEVVFQGSVAEYRAANTLLSRYLSGESRMPERQSVSELTDYLHLEHACAHYLKDLDVAIPLHCMVGIAGMSGSGKSSLIRDTLLKRLATAKKYGKAAGLEGNDRISGYATISQEPIGRSASSTPASYIGIWDKIRELYAAQPQAVACGMSAGDFSFHSKGACPACGGSGYEKIYLTTDFTVDKLCPSCLGKRYRQESLEVLFHGKSISEVLELSISEAIPFFQGYRSIVRPLQILSQMGMGYLKLGQPSTTLSGGEAQRVKLAKELGKQQKGNMLYVLDEPTTGLSLYDTALLLQLLDQLVADGNSIIVIEHNVEVLKKCDYIIELGPGGGDKGGEIIATGTPEQLHSETGSITGKYLIQPICAGGQTIEGGAKIDESASQNGESHK